MLINLLLTMKLRFIFSLLFFVCIIGNMYAFCNVQDTIHQANDRQIVDAADASNQTDSFIDYDSLSKKNHSAQSNNLTMYSIIVAVFGVLVGVITSMAVAAHNNRRDDVKGLMKEIREENKEFKKEIENAINNQETAILRKFDEIKRLRVDIEARANEISKIQEQQNYQYQYLQRINLYLFSITNSVIDSKNGNPEMASGIRNSLYNQYHIIKVFLPWSDSPTDGTEAAFRYLQANGTEENVKDLQFIANNDPDENKRIMAIETIGYIRGKTMNG